MNYTAQTFSGDTLRGQDYISTTFNSCRLTGDLKFSSFKDCTFTNCDFSGVHLDGTLFDHCYLHGCKLNHLDFSQTTFLSVDFSDSLMMGCVFQRLTHENQGQRKKLSLKGCIFDRAQLADSIFVFVEMELVQFVGADLRQTSFDRCSIVKTNFSEADLGGTSFRDCRIHQAQLTLDGFVAYGQSKGFTLSDHDPN